ncbi:hypothetical protein L2E82_28018 [Cichorium intybus]|uniref:Uncharacterized protein n=1 Tax=Cichorium intybus TaxID=13427 RepID=A0ACB9CUP2_CICIN|nr:hypothetical protein L2E82_28018 [Cichorium intybus]
MLIVMDCCINVFFCFMGLYCMMLSYRVFEQSLSCIVLKVYLDLLKRGVEVLMIVKGLFRRYERWNPVHPTYGAFWGMRIGVGCGIGWGMSLTGRTKE